MMLTIQEASEVYGEHVTRVHRGEPSSDIWSAGAAHAVAKAQLERCRALIRATRDRFALNEHAREWCDYFLDRFTPGGPPSQRRVLRLQLPSGRVTEVEYTADESLSHVAPRIMALVNADLGGPSPPASMLTPEAMDKAWESAQTYMRARGVDPEAVLRRAGENLARIARERPPLDDGAVPGEDDDEIPAAAPEFVPLNESVCCGICGSPSYQVSRAIAERELRAAQAVAEAAALRGALRAMVGVHAFDCAEGKQGNGNGPCDCPARGVTAALGDAR